jgi:hypothetical protein
MAFSRLLSYRCYLLDPADRMRSFVIIRVSSDEEAIAEGRHRAQVTRTAFELWRGNEMIHRETSNDQFSFGEGNWTKPITRRS